MSRPKKAKTFILPKSETHEPECVDAGKPYDDACPTCDLMRIGFERGFSEATIGLLILMKSKGVTL